MEDGNIFKIGESWSISSPYFEENFRCDLNMTTDLITAVPVTHIGMQVEGLV